MEKGLSEKSKKLFNGKLKVLKERGIDIDKNWKEILEDIKDESQSWIKTSIQAIKYYLETKDKEKYKDICDEIAIKVKEINDKMRQDKEEKEKKKEEKDIDDEEESEEEEIIEWENILKVQKKMMVEMEELDKEWLTDLVILSIYCLFPVRGVQDISEMEIINSKETDMGDDKNYYIQNTRHFVFNVYKSKDAQKQKFKISKELADILNYYIDKNEIDGSLLNMSSHKLSQMIKNIFKGKKLNNLFGNKVMGKIFDEWNITNTVMKKSYIEYMKRKGLYKNKKQINDIKSKMGLKIEE